MGVGLVSIGLIAWLWQPPIALASPAQAPFMEVWRDRPLMALSDPERQELEQFRVDQRIEVLLERRLATDPNIRDRIELEVDRAFDRTTTILNVLLVILTSLPILVALGVWLLRRSVVSELVSEVRSQLEKEVLSELKKQRESSIQELERSKSEALDQLVQMSTDADVVLNELKAQIDIANQEIDSLKSEATSRIQGMVSDAQVVKDQTIQELTGILPPSTRDPLPPEAQPKIGRLTAFLDSLKSAVPQLTFTASDYAKQGNALFFESRYEDAIAAYDRAIQLNDDLYEAWFGRGSTLVILQHYEEAIAAYQSALGIRPDSYEAWLGQAAVLRKLEQPQDAIAAYDQALSLKPDDPLLWFSRGNVYLDLGDNEQALTSYQRVLNLKPDFARGWLNHSVALRRLGRLDAAIASAKELLMLKVNDADGLYCQACNYAKQGDMDEAIANLEAAIHQNSGLAKTAAADPELAPLRDSDRIQALFQSNADDS